MQPIQKANGANLGESIEKGGHQMHHHPGRVYKNRQGECRECGCNVSEDSAKRNMR
jgi:hypothetical protein